MIEEKKTPEEKDTSPVPPHKEAKTSMEESIEGKKGSTKGVEEKMIEEKKDGSD